MEHKNLTLEDDKNLINKILDDIEMRYVILFLYVVRNDLFENLNDQEIIDSYQRVLILDEVFKGNLLSFWKKPFLEIAIDLGLLRNIRSLREFETKEDDFIVKLGDEMIKIEQNIIIIPEELIFLMIKKKFKFLTKRHFNLALTRLKAVRCERSNAIHPFIFEIGENSYCLSDDLYYILDQFGNIYQAIKIEIVIEGFYARFKEIKDKIEEFIKIFDPLLNSRNVIKKINKAIEENKNIVKYLKDEKVILSDKFDVDDINEYVPIYKDWNSKLSQLLKFRFQMEKIDDKLSEIKSFYSGKNKKYSYMKFIENISFNEDNIVDKIQDELISLRKELVEINNETSKLTKKDVKLLNLDYERFIIANSGD
ncbi:MAG: hypothetical protein ACFE8A_10820 [Candidatus Hodarchaeota archaeon]